MSNNEPRILRLTLFCIALQFLCLHSNGQSQPNAFSSFTIDSSLNTKLTKAKSQSQYNFPMIADGFWFLGEKSILELSDENIDIDQFFDTLQSYSEVVVCDCMIKKDTIYLQGGIGYEGAIGFDLRIVGKLFSGRIYLSGVGFKTTDSLDYRKVVLFNSTKQTLKLQSPDSLKMDKKIIGELFLESEGYLEKGSETPRKLYMKILFGCTLDDVIVL